MGTLEFKNLAKPLQFQGTRNTELRVEAVPGNIVMDLGEFTAKNVVGPVRLVTRSRDIRLEDFTNSLDLQTERGDIELQVASVPVPRIEARSGVGRIDLVLPERAAFELQATAERGEALNDFGPQIEKQVQGRTSILKTPAGSGPVIRLTADRGSVSVRKAGTELPQGLRPAVPQPPKPPATTDLKGSEVKL